MARRIANNARNRATNRPRSSSVGDVINYRTVGTRRINQYLESKVDHLPSINRPQIPDYLPTYQTTTQVSTGIYVGSIGWNRVPDRYGDEVTRASIGINQIIGDS